MIKSIDTKYKKEDVIHFVIDDDEKMTWLSKWEINSYEKIFIVIDKNVKKIWGNLLLGLFKSKKGKRIHIYEVEATERSKSILFYPQIVRFLENNSCNLSDLVIAIGGGVIIDLVSFTCSTYMRGVPFAAIPTTLTGMVDASTAGKTCLNTSNNKNILGTFYYPGIVYNNIHFLKTCSNYFNRQGFSEVFKYALLGSEKLLRYLRKYYEKPSTSILKRIIELTIKTRIKIRKIHPQASNLGHTFGHTFEKMSGYKILHGDAISAGIATALFLGVKRGVIDKRKVDGILRSMKKFHLNLYIDRRINTAEMIEIMRHDKKSSGSFLNLVLIRDISRPYKENGQYFYQVKPSIVKSFMDKFIKTYPYAINNCANYIKKDFLNYEKY